MSVGRVQSDDTSIIPLFCGLISPTFSMHDLNFACACFSCVKEFVRWLNSYKQIMNCDEGIFYQEMGINRTSSSCLLTSDNCGRSKSVTAICWGWDGLAAMSDRSKQISHCRSGGSHRPLILPSRRTRPSPFFSCWGMSPSVVLQDVGESWKRNSSENKKLKISSW